MASRFALRSPAEAGPLDVVLVPGAGNRGTIAATENPAILGFLRQAHDSNATHAAPSV